MRTNNGGLSEASRQAQESISQVQAAEARLQKVDSILSRMGELAAKSADGTTTDAERIVLDFELTPYTFELSKFGELSLCDYDPEQAEDVAANGTPAGLADGNTAGIAQQAIRIGALGNIRDEESARSAVSTIGDARALVAESKDRLSELKSRLTIGAQGAVNPAERQPGPEGRVRDTGSAMKIVEQIRSGLLSRPSESVNAQANALPLNVAQLVL